MHIAQLHWAFPPVIGGVESHLAMLGPELVRNNYQVSLLTGAMQGLAEEYQYEGMYVKRVPSMDLNSLTPEKIVKMAGTIKQDLVQFINQVKPDVIHTHNMHYFSPVHADILYEVKQTLGIPLVLTAHNVWADEDKTWQEMNKRAHYWDAVIAVSEYIKGELVRVGYEPKRITTIHHGIDLERFARANEYDLAASMQSYPELAGRRVIFHPARMSLDKGCHISVKALDIIRKEFPDVLLVLAGTGKTVDWGSHQQRHVQEILGLIEDLDLKEHVFVKFFAWTEMPAMYKTAEFCIYPSCFEEPFGLVMLESMATGKPIIVSRAGGMPEIIKDGINGFVIPMHDEVALAERCCQLLRDSDLREQMGETGRKMVEKYWTKEIMTKATMNIYSDVTQPTDSPNDRAVSL